MIIKFKRAFLANKYASRLLHVESRAVHLFSSFSSSSFRLILKMPQRLTHREMVSYGFKPGEPWGEQRRELERAFDRADRSNHGGMSNRSLSSGLPPSSYTIAPAANHRQHSTGSLGHGRSRHSGYGTVHMNHADYASPGRTTYAQDPWMQYRGSTHRSVSSRTSSPTPSYTTAARTSGRSYSHGYAPSSNYAPTTYQSRSGSSRYSGYGYSGSESSASYAPRSVYDTDDDDDYTHLHAPSSTVESEPHSFTSGYVETTFVVEPSESGSEASYSGEHSSYGSGSESGSEHDDDGSCSGSEGDSIYSDGTEEYDDYDDNGSYSDDGGYYSDD
ncbi:hypothetical protein C8R43DRAFT_706917 [Mycena crocata]|nr:hypothetical protein C8R43DRAFT_706917 [Mycena crocata]